MKTSNKLLIAGLAISTIISSCKKDEDDVVTPPKTNEEEVITSMLLTFTDSSGEESVKLFSFRDPDGDGGNDPVQFDTIKVSANKTYNVLIELLNETIDPPDVISEEVKNEADEHIFCFDPSASNLTIERTDSDGMFEIGLESKWITTNQGNGTVTVSLKHQPDGAKDGTCTPGETDVEVSFQLVVQ